MRPSVSRTALFAGIALATAMSASAASPSQPKRPGPIVTVFAGSDWNLVAWRRTRGVCISYGAPGASVFGCNPLPHKALDVMFFGTGQMIGTVAANVARVVVKGRHGRLLAVRLSRTLRALKTTRHFFLAEGPLLPRILPRYPRQAFTVLAYNDQGKLLGRFP